MITRSHGERISPLCPITRVHRWFLPVVVILFSCSSLHKTAERSVSKEKLTDRSVIDSSATIHSITTEKADTTLQIKGDSASIGLYIPRGMEVDDTDTMELRQEVNGNHLKVVITARPVIVNGKKAGTRVTATAIQKPDSVKVVIDKTTVTTSRVETSTHKDISDNKATRTKDKDIQRKGLGFTWSLISVILILVLLIVAYLYLKNKIKNL